MNIRENAQLIVVRRLKMVKAMLKGGLRYAEAAAEAGGSPPIARKWLGRYLAESEAGHREPLSIPTLKMCPPMRFDSTKVRFRGISKNANHLFATRALANLFVARSRLIRAQGT